MEFFMCECPPVTDLDSAKIYFAREWLAEALLLLEEPSVNDRRVHLIYEQIQSAYNSLTVVKGGSE